MSCAQDIQMYPKILGRDCRLISNFHNYSQRPLPILERKYFTLEIFASLTFLPFVLTGLGSPVSLGLSYDLVENSKKPGPGLFCWALYPSPTPNMMPDTEDAKVLYMGKMNEEKQVKFWNSWKSVGEWIWLSPYGRKDRWIKQIWDESPSAMTLRSKDLPWSSRRSLELRECPGSPVLTSECSRMLKL